MSKIEYKEIYNYWNRYRCRGGNPNFPFKLYHCKKVLEIGYGDGIDGFRFVHAGAIYTGIDIINPLTPSYFRKMNAEEIDYPDNHFDLVYSWGVIHHTINPEKVIKEIYRVLKPDGQFYILLYNKFSFRYLIEIMFLRKILWYLHYWKYDKIRRKIPHPTKVQWISMNTDGVECPLSRVFSKEDALKLFDRFGGVHSFTRNKGWFRIIIGRK